MKAIFRKFMNKFGYDIQARNFLRSHEIRRSKFMNDHNISVVLDVGANEGQYALSLRMAGYKNKIISFEPVQEVFQLLTKKSSIDPKWEAINIALGDFDGYTDINIADFSQVSSILLATGLATTEYWKGNRKQKIQVRKLDSMIDELNIESNRIYLKIDTQGFEKNVLMGSSKLLSTNVILLETELSIREFYAGETIFSEMLTYIKDMGFELVSMSPVHVDFIRGYVLQYDCIFIKKDILDSQ